MKIKISLFIALILPAIVLGQAPDPTRFAEEVETIEQKDFNIDQNKPIVVFTGSSSVRMWTDVPNYYPQVNAINTAIGGSHYTDLIFYQQELIYDFAPEKIFIYEGDNDIDAGFSPSEILGTAAYLYAQIRQKLPDTQIYLLTPKPSISRWHLKEEYEAFNSLLEDFCKYDENLYFVDVWTPMLNDDGVVRDDIFISDNLHMNETGYKIWGNVLGNFLK